MQWLPLSNPRGRSEWNGDVVQVRVDIGFKKDLWQQFGQFPEFLLTLPEVGFLTPPGADILFYRNVVHDVPVLASPQGVGCPVPLRSAADLLV